MENYIIAFLTVSLIVTSIFLILKLQRSKFQTEIIQLKIQNNNLIIDNNNFQNLIAAKENALDEEKILKFENEKNNEILKIQIKDMRTRIEEWEQMRDKTIEHAKAAIFEAGGKLSSKLIEDHKRESNEQTKRSQENFKETTTEFQKQFISIVETVGSLNDQVKDSKKTVDIVKQALLSPSGAGNLAEITLENILKSSGLISGTDYFMQYSFVEKENNSILRPDAVVFLPGNNLMVIDSKASKFFTELIENDNVILREKLVSSMRNHLKTLISKNYKDAIRSSLKKDNTKNTLNHISMIMFLPSETALEKLREYDPDFMNKAWENHIYPTGPISLVNVLSHARFQISENNQVENYKHIIDEVSSLVSNIGTLYEHARKVGSSLQSATVNFDKFAGTFNSRVLSKAKKLNKLGVTEKTKKALPSALERFQVISTDKMTILEVEASEEDETKQLSDK